jgi:hypothetical protein
MSKQPIPVAREIRPAQPKSKLSRIAPILVASALLGPLAAEGASFCYAQWCEVLGVPAEAHTPILDLAGAGLSNAHDLLGESIASGLQNSIRDVSFVLPLAAVLIVVAMAMLRR